MHEVPNLARNETLEIIVIRAQTLRARQRRARTGRHIDRKERSQQECKRSRREQRCGARASSEWIVLVLRAKRDQRVRVQKIEPRVGPEAIAKLDAIARKVLRRCVRVARRRLPARCRHRVDIAAPTDVGVDGDAGDGDSDGR